MALSLAIPGLVGLYAAAVVAARVRSRRAQAWAAETAADLPEARLLDDGRDGVALRRGGQEVRAARLGGLLDGDGVLLELELGAPMPPGLDVRRAPLLFGDATPRVPIGDGSLDPSLEVRGLDAPWTRRTLGSKAVAGSLAAVDAWGSLALSAGVLRLVLPRVVFAPALISCATDLAALGEALTDTSVSLWRRRGRLSGLRLHVDGPLGMGLVSVDGATSLRFSTARPQDEGAQVLRQRIGGGFPVDVSIRPRRPGEPAGRALHDLILDRAVRANGGPAELGAALGRDAVRGPLLTWLHGRDAPRLVAGQLELRTPGGGAPVLLRRVTELRDLAGLLAGLPWR